MTQWSVVLAFAIAFMATAHADTHQDICDRGVIGKAIAAATGSETCARVSVQRMAALVELEVDGPTGIAENAFQGLTSLRRLTLGNGSVPTLAAGRFKGLSKLNRLLIGPSGIETIEPGAFEGLVALEELGIFSEDKLKEIPGGVLQDIPALEKLTIKWCGLAALTGETLRGLRNVRMLDLRLNKIARIDENAFSDLISAESLILYANQISALPADAFRGVPLRWLDLSYNPLEKVPPAVRDLARLQRLDLAGAGIRTLPADSFAGLGSLLFLDLNGNELQSISGEPLVGLSSLKKLRLEKNRIAAIEPGSFRELVDLGELNLDENALSSIQADTFVGLGSLETLVLSHNRIRTLANQAFQGTAALRLLDLSFNCVSEKTICRECVGLSPEVAIYSFLSNDCPKPVAQPAGLPAHFFTREET